MVDYLYKRSIVKIREMAFESIVNIKKRKEDVWYLHSNDEENKLEKGYAVACKQYTLVNDLEQSEEELLTKIKKNCKYEIRRAKKEEVVINVYESKELINKSEIVEEFSKTYNEMFKSKDMNNRFNFNLFNEGINAGQIILTTASCPIDNNCIVYHAYLVDGRSTVLMYSASPLWEDGDKQKANMIGRMNKYLHWSDLVWFKNNCYTRYEWGGIASKDNPNGIDKFKMEFGGDVKQYYNYTVAKTLLGKMYVYLVKLKQKKQD